MSMINTRRDEVGPSRLSHCNLALPAVERMWHMLNSQAHDLALALGYVKVKPFQVVSSSLGSSQSIGLHYYYSCDPSVL